MMQALEPFFPVNDIPATAAFWRDSLGFDVTGQSESRLRVARDEVAIMFGAGTPPKAFDGLLIVRTEDVTAFASSVDATPHWGPRETPDQRLEVAYSDPNGYIVNFSQNTNKAGDLH